MVHLYRMSDLNRIGYTSGRVAVDFPKDLSQRPPEFRDMSIVEMLTVTERPGYLIHQIKLDPESGKHYIEDFAVNCADQQVDSAPLVRGFITEGNVHMSEPHTLYEIMPNKKEIHVIPDPQRRLFYDAHKASNDPFCMEVVLDEVLDEFAQAGFTVRHFEPQFNLLGNPNNPKRYFGEKGHESVKEGI